MKSLSEINSSLNCSNVCTFFWHVGQGLLQPREEDGFRALGVHAQLGQLGPQLGHLHLVEVLDGHGGGRSKDQGGKIGAYS